MKTSFSSSGLSELSRVSGVSGVSSLSDMLSSKHEDNFFKAAFFAERVERILKLFGFQV